MYKNIWNIWIDLVDFSARSTATGGLSNTDRLFKNGFGFTVLGLIFDIFYFPKSTHAKKPYLSANLTQ